MSDIIFSSPPADLVVMGHIYGAFGVQGWIKLRTYCRSAENLFSYPYWWIKQHDAYKACRFIEGTVHNKGVVAKLENINTRDTAALLKGATIAISRTQMPTLEQDSYYWTDLIGLTVVNANTEQILGQVAYLIETGANDVLVVKSSSDKKHLIPFVATVVGKVDLASKKIEVTWDADF